PSPSGRGELLEAEGAEPWQEGKDLELFTETSPLPEGEGLGVRAPEGRAAVSFSVIAEYWLGPLARPRVRHAPCGSTPRRGRGPRLRPGAEPCGERERPRAIGAERHQKEAQATRPGPGLELLKRLPGPPAP